jgi:hypothetical protein
MKLYVNGQLLYNQDVKKPWETVKQITFKATQPTVVAINCVDTGPPGALILSASNNIVSDSSWRCSNTDQPGWTNVSII